MNMKTKTDAMRMVAMSIKDYAKEMAVEPPQGGLHHLRDLHLQRHLNKLVAHMLEAAAVVDSLELLGKPGSWAATSAKSDD